MLIELREFIREQGVCSLWDLSVKFKTSPDAMRGMLSHWQKKGKVELERSGCSKGCSSCSPEQLEIYRWRGSDRIPLCNR